MTRRILFAGGRLDSLEVINTGATETTSTTGRDTTYTDASIDFPYGSAGALRARFRDSSFSTVSVSSGTVYAHCETMSLGSAIGSRNLMELADSSGAAWLAIRCPTANTNTFGLYYNSGTAGSPVWTLLGSTTTYATSTRYAYDIKFTFGSPHTAELYRDGVLVTSATFTQAALTELSSMAIRAYSNTTGQACRFSQILAAEELSTIGAKVAYVRANGAGSNSEWTGSVTDINEGNNSDITLNSATSAGLTQTYTMGDVTLPSGYVIKSIFQWLRAKNDGVSPLNIKSVLRLGGSNYVSASDLSGIGTGLAPVGTRYDEDPSTAAAWTASGWNAAEMGFQSAA